ncbi:MAG: GNAT family N-acetyltransferase [Anaerolineaceae bacterium]|nr:GNAT family N-acetyltransferase [Anaerolineaceae bacterium]
MGNTIKQSNGYTFRRLRDDADFEKMYDIFNIMRVADEYGWCYDDLNEFIDDWRTTPNLTPEQHMVLLEHNGKAIGYGFVYWTVEEDQFNAFKMNYSLIPGYRTPELNQTFLEVMEEQIHNRLSEGEKDKANILKVFNFQKQVEKVAALKSNSYRPVRYFYMMTRPIDMPLIDAPLPNGLVVRPPREDEYRKVFSAVNEAFKDHYGHSELTEEQIQSWMKMPTFQPHLWKIAWDGDEIAGNVLNYIAEAENKEYHRKRGYTETISVRRPWRKMGVARALLTQSIAMHRELGMEETALGVDATNPNGALKLYESVGYSVISEQTIYQKDL